MGQTRSHARPEGQTDGCMKDPLGADAVVMREIFPVYKKEYARGGSRLCSTSNGKNLPPTGPVLGVGKILVKTGPDISRKNLPPNPDPIFPVDGAGSGWAFAQIDDPRRPDRLAAFGSPQPGRWRAPWNPKKTSRW